LAPRRIRWTIGDPSCIVSVLFAGAMEAWARREEIDP
jgi:hypothetical protein